MLQFYMTPVGIIMVVICSLIIFGAVWIFSKKFSLSKLQRALIAAAVAFAGVAAMTWDVVITSVKMTEICASEMLVVRRSVVVEGFYARYGSPDMLDKKFKFLESKGIGNKIDVFTRAGNSIGKEVFNANDYRIKSQYEYIFNAVDGLLDGRRDISFQKTVVRDRETGEELGYAISYTAHPGWVDRNTAGLITQIFWTCQSDLNQNAQLRARVLLPE